MQEDYLTPEVQLIGYAEDLVLGGFGFGTDFSGEWQAAASEFDDD